jgi:uncharacterized protein (TIGR02996 family)
MTADERALVQAIIANPDDDLPRLVYADWLEEHGRPERAEFIRVQCWLSRAHLDRVSESLASEWRSREKVLIRDHMPSWRLQLPPHLSSILGEFRRGMIEVASINCPSAAGDWGLRMLADALAVHPLRDLNVGISYNPSPARLLGWPGLRRFRYLRLSPSSAYVAREVAAEVIHQVLSHDWDDQPEWVELKRWDFRCGLPNDWTLAGGQLPRLDMRSCRLQPADQRALKSRLGDRVLL